MQTELDRKHSIGITNNIIDCYILRADREHATQVLICVVSTQYSGALLFQTPWEPERTILIIEVFLFQGLKMICTIIIGLHF